VSKEEYFGRKILKTMSLLFDFKEDRCLPGFIKRSMMK